MEQETSSKSLKQILKSILALYNKFPTEKDLKLLMLLLKIYVKERALKNIVTKKQPYAIYD